MQTFTKDILEGGGEGMIIKQLQSLYENGRTNCWLKVKAVRDYEALVVEIHSKYYLCLLYV
jgi:ATP-dependent DNA ligase